MARPIVEDSDITAEWLFAQFAKAEEHIPVDPSTISNIEVERIGDGRAFLSRVFRLKFHLDVTNPAIPSSIILKIPGLSYKKVQSVENARREEEEDANETRRNQIQRLIKYHNAECAFYRCVAPKLVTKLPTAKAYAFKEMGFDNDGALLLEDCADANVVGYFETLTAKQIESVVIHIAYFHAWSLCGEAYDLMAESDADLKLEYAKSLTTFCSTLFPKAKEIAPGAFDQLLDKLTPFIDNDDYHNYAANLFFKDTGLPKVLTHGDLWSHNILWKANGPDGHTSDELRAIVDWQMVRYDNQMQDVARLLVNSCSSEVRKSSESRILQLYKTHFDRNIREIFSKERMIGELSVDELCSSITIEKLEKAYRFAFLFETIKATMYLPLMNDALQRGVAVNQSSESNAHLLEGAIQKTKSIVEDCLQILQEDYPEWL